MIHITTLIHDFELIKIQPERNSDSISLCVPIIYHTIYVHCMFLASFAILTTDTRQSSPGICHQ